MTTLRQRLHTAYKAAGNSKTERRNDDGTFTIDGSTWIATRELIQMIPVVETALWKLEELEKEQAKWVTIRRDTME